MNAQLLATLDAQAADVSASRAQPAEAADVIAALRRTRDEQAAELALLRTARKHTCVFHPSCQCDGCTADREWRAKYGSPQ